MQKCMQVQVLLSAPYTKHLEVKIKVTPDELFHKNKALVGYCYNKFIQNQLLQDKEDIIQQGMLALWIVANKYDSSNGTTFTSYAVPYIKGYMKSYVHDKLNTIKIPRTAFESGDIDLIYNLSNIESLDAQIQFDNDSEAFTLLDTISAPADDYPGLTKDLVDRFLATIENNRDKSILKSYYYGIIQNNIPNKRKLSELHGISYQTVLNIIYKYNEKFKHYLKDCIE